MNFHSPAYYNGLEFVSRSKKDKKQGQRDFSLKRDVRKEKNRGFRRHVKLEIKAGNYDFPDTPKSSKVNDEREQ